MTTNNVSLSGGSFCVVAVLAAVVGSMVFGYGLLVVPQSVLGGLWIAAIGLSLLLSGLFATEWAGERFGLSAAARRRLTLVFAVLAALLLVAFVVVNFATFAPGSAESSS